MISVTERTATIGRIRNLARQVAEIWLAEREALGFPLLAHSRRLATTQCLQQTSPPRAMPPCACCQVREAVFRCSACRGLLYCSKECQK